MNDFHFTCAILDDEPDAIELLISRLERLFPNAEVRDTFSNWEDAFLALRRKKYDLLFTDISMPGKNGLELLSLLPDLDCEIIFVTAHDTYALKAFAFAASGYLLKPVDDAELLAAVTRTLDRIKLKKLADQASKTQGRQEARLRIPGNNGADFVHISDVVYLESVNKCTRIVTTTKQYTSSYNIGTFKFLEDDHSFVQVHRAFIVNLDHVTRYEGGQLYMKDQTVIPVARASRQNLQQVLGGN